MANFAKNIDDFNNGDKIKIHTLDDPFLNIDWRLKEGVVTRIDYTDNALYGTWGSLNVFPEYDDIEILEHAELTPIM